MIIYCSVMRKFIYISLIMVLACCTTMTQWEEMQKTIKSTPNNEKVTVLRRAVKDESVTEFKQRVHKHCEWATKHGRTVYKIEYEPRDIYHKTYYYAEAVIYWRKDDS